MSKADELFVLGSERGDDDWSRLLEMHKYATSLEVTISELSSAQKEALKEVPKSGAAHKVKKCCGGCGGCGGSCKDK